MRQAPVQYCAPARSDGLGCGCHVQQIALGVVDLLQVSVRRPFVAGHRTARNSKPLARCMVPIEMCPLAVPAQHVLWELVAQFGTNFIVRLVCMAVRGSVAL